MSDDGRRRGSPISFPIVRIGGWAPEAPVIYRNFPTLIRIRGSSLSWAVCCRRLNNDPSVSFSIPIRSRSMRLGDDISRFGFA